MYSPKIYKYADNFFMKHGQKRLIKREIYKKVKATLLGGFDLPELKAPKVLPHI
jgi:hypothetical protein